MVATLMTGPDLAGVAALVLDDRGRIRREAARMVTREFRCEQRHLQAFIVRTVAGAVVFWRPSWARTARDVWSEEWLDLLPATIRATCHCRENTVITLTP